MFHMFSSEREAFSYANKLKKELRIRIVVLHRVFEGIGDRYVVGRWRMDGNKRRFIAYR